MRAQHLGDGRHVASFVAARKCRHNVRHRVPQECIEHVDAHETIAVHTGMLACERRELFPLAIRNTSGNRGTSAPQSTPLGGAASRVVTMLRPRDRFAARPLASARR
jgi:hypothetical protein